MDTMNERIVGLERPIAPVAPGAILSVRGLSVSFATARGPVEVVRGIDLDIYRGETLALVGESGCGKSVTSLAVMGLLPPGAALRGSMRFTDCKGFALELSSASAGARRNIRGRRIGMVFQEPMTSLNPMMTIGDQIAEPLVAHGLAGQKEARGRAVELLREMGVPDPERRSRALPHEFSGGMRQRAMIALALACDPALLIADEPTTALDVTIQAQILNLLRRMREARGTSCLFISHDLAVVAEIADRVAVMYAGEIVEEGPVSIVLGSPAHPYTRALIASRPDIGAKRQRLATIPGAVPEPHARPQGCAFHPRCPVARPGVCEADRPERVTHARRAVRCVYGLGAPV